MGRISPGPTRWPPGTERRLVPAKSNLKPQTSKLFSPEGTPRHERAAHRHNVPYRPPAKLEQPEPTLHDRHDPTHPTAGQAGHWAAQTIDDVPTTVMPTTQQPHARTSRNRAHRETTSPTGNKRRRDNYSDQTRPAGPIRATTQPRRADRRRTNAGEPTPRTGHAPVAAHTPHRTGRPPQPDERTGKTAKTTSDYIGAGYTTSCRSN